MKNHVKSAKYAVGNSVKPQIVPLTLAIGGILSAGTTQAGTITVDSLESGHQVDLCTLRSALVTASSGNQAGRCATVSGDDVTIEFSSSLNGTIQEQGLEAHSLDKLEINGAGRITVQGDGSDRILEVKTSVETLVLRGLTISNGYSEIDAGGVDSRADHLEVRESVITGNTGSQGAGIHHRPSGRGSVFVYDSTFSRNEALAAAGLGVMMNSGGPVRIYHSEFNDNEATSGSGGALGVVTSDTSEMDIKYNEFTENSAGTGGGAILARFDNVDGDIRFNNIRNNSSYESGAGMLLEAENSMIGLDGNNVTSNVAGLGNPSITSGGGIKADLTNSEIHASDLTLGINTAFGSGGGMAVYGDEGSVLELEEAHIYLNYAHALGGGLSIRNTIDTFRLSYSEITNNDAGIGGGGLSLWESNGSPIQAVVRHSEISENTTADANGGGIALLSDLIQTTLKVYSSTLSGNQANQSRGGAIGITGTPSLAVMYSTIVDNSAATLGNGIFTTTNGECAIRNSVFRNFEGPEPDDIYSRVSNPCSVSHSLITAAEHSNFFDNGGNILYEGPQLGPLSDHGGIGGRTHKPLSSSPIIGAGKILLSAPDYDQRGEGFPREVGSGLDMGAYETQTVGDVEDAIFSDRFED